VASPTLVSRPDENRWSAAASLCGAAVWALFATLAGLQRAHFGIIELLFLFAPLVIVPLGLELAHTLASSSSGQLAKALRISHFPAALAVCIASWLPPGRTSALLSVLWLLQCALLACDRFPQSRRPGQPLLSIILSIAQFDLVLGATWLVISRAGWRPMGFQEPIILLTAVHFHYSGFATALIASVTLRAFEKRRLPMPGLRTLIVLIVYLPFLLAAGFVFSPMLRFVAAIALSTCVTALAMVAGWCAGELRTRPARIYLRAASCAAAAAFSLAGFYAVSEYFGKGWITLPGMANSHGVLNGLGFVLFSMLAWLTELHGSESGGEARPPSHPEELDVAGQARSQARSGAVPDFGTGRSVPVPEFVARDFYDR